MIFVPLADNNLFIWKLQCKSKWPSPSHPVDIETFTWDWLIWNRSIMQFHNDRGCCLSYDGKPCRYVFFTGDFPAWLCLYWYGSQKGFTLFFIRNRFISRESSIRKVFFRKSDQKVTGQREFLKGKSRGRELFLWKTSHDREIFRRNKSRGSDYIQRN